MNRLSFLRSLATLIAAPKLLMEAAQPSITKEYGSVTSFPASERELAIFKRNQLINKEKPSGYYVDLERGYEFRYAPEGISPIDQLYSFKYNELRKVYPEGEYYIKPLNF